MKLEFKIPDTAGLVGSEEFTVLSNRLRKIVQSGGSLSNEGEERKEKIKIGRFPDDDLKIQGFCIGSVTMMFIVGPTPAHRFEIVHET